MSHDVGERVARGVQGGVGEAKWRGDASTSASLLVDDGELALQVAEEAPEVGQRARDASAQGGFWLLTPARVFQVGFTLRLGANEARLVEARDLVGAVPEGDGEQLVQARAEVELEGSRVRSPEEATGAVHHLVRPPLGHVGRIERRVRRVLEEALILAHPKDAALPDAVRFVVGRHRAWPLEHSVDLAVHGGRSLGDAERHRAQTEGRRDDLAERETRTRGERHGVDLSQPHGEVRERVDPQLVALGRELTPARGRQPRHDHAQSRTSWKSSVEK